MSKIFFQLGANRELSSKELETTFTRDVALFSNFAILEMSKKELNRKFEELGGSIRAGEIIEKINNIEGVVDKICLDTEKNHQEGKKTKIAFCLENSKWKKYGKLLFKEVKNKLKEKISLRVVNRDLKNLDNFAFKKEKLNSDGNAEYVIIFSNEIFLGKTISIQNADDFITRDVKKPIRDMEVGMLPAKLARIMINLARENGYLPQKIYDPFCGTGTVLLEGLSIKLKIAGSDISEKMVSATKKNTKWYYDDKNNKKPFFIKDIFTKDVQEQFKKTELIKIKDSVVVSEGFLGRIFTRKISEKDFLSQKEYLFPLYRKMFLNFKNEFEKIVIALPFWKGKKQDYSFIEDLINFIEKIGLSVDSEPILYIRKDQVVGRTIVKIKKL